MGEGFHALEFRHGYRKISKVLKMLKFQALKGLYPYPNFLPATTGEDRWVRMVVAEFRVDCHFAGPIADSQ